MDKEKRNCVNEMIKVVNSEKGNKSIDDSFKNADKTVEKLSEARKIRWETLGIRIGFGTVHY